MINKIILIFFCIVAMACNVHRHSESNNIITISSDSDAIICHVVKIVTLKESLNGKGVYDIYMNTEYGKIVVRSIFDPSLPYDDKMIMCNGTYKLKLDRIQKETEVFQNPNSLKIGDKNDSALIVVSTPSITLSGSLTHFSAPVSIHMDYPKYVSNNLNGLYIVYNQ